MTQHYDLIVIGNGSAGDNIARNAARAGKRVAVVEREHLGGECLNDGCVPSKALINIAARYGPGLPWSEVLAKVEAVQLNVRGSDPNGGMRGDGIDLHWGEARFTAPTALRVGDTELSADTVAVATGTAPSLPPIAGLAEARPITNREVFHLPERPGRLAVIGGGAIGLELAQAFHRLGSEVTIFEAADRIATTEDERVSIELTKLFSRDGIRIIAGARIENVRRNEGGTVEIRTGDGLARFDEVLVAAGRKAQVPAGLEDLGLKLTERGYVDIDGCGHTNLDGLWAAGDITGKFQFTHYASYQAHHIVRHIVDDTCAAIPDAVVPWAIFTDPEVGHVGLTEAQAREQHGDGIRTAVLETAELDWFRTTGNTDGFAFVIADAEGTLLGAHFVCAQGSTLAGEASLAIAHGMTAKDVASTIHPYPTASELFRWACAKLA